jgi:hypothetical protein
MFVLSVIVHSVVAHSPKVYRILLRRHILQNVRISVDIGNTIAIFKRGIKKASTGLLPNSYAVRGQRQALNYYISTLVTQLSGPAGVVCAINMPLTPASFFFPVKKHPALIGLRSLK